MGRAYNPDAYHRRSIRLQGYDYRQAGAYFITICAQDRECFFGEILGDVMCLSDAGQMLQAAWDELPQFYPGVDTDAFVIMPNHIHGIIVLNTDTSTSTSTGSDAHPEQITGGLSLPDVVYRFKSLTTTRYRQGVLHHKWQPFPGKLWQRNYYEHVIRDEEDLNRIREYIISNPARWSDDENNPARNP